MSDLVHFPVRSADGRWLFETWVEARWLWDLLNRHVDYVALVIMLDHFHSLCRAKDLLAVKNAMRAYALKRNVSRGESGPVWRRKERGTIVKSTKQRNVLGAYIHRNPVVAGLVDDPLAWPFSTHRDAVGLAIPCVRRTAPDPERFHETVRYVRERPHLRQRSLPQGLAALTRPELLGECGGRQSTMPKDLVLRQIQAAVSALTRTPEELFWKPAPARSLFVRCARVLAKATTAEISAFSGMSRMTVLREPRTMSDTVALVERVLGDDRFTLLQGGNLRQHLNGRY